MNLSKTLESPGFLNESSVAPKIKVGASSSSDILNRWIQALQSDIVLMSTRMDSLATRAQRMDIGTSSQSGAISSALSSLVSRVNSLTASGMVFADLYTSQYIDSTQTVADINPTFGQATLPIQSQTDLLVQLDIYGNPYVSPDVVVSYSFTSSQTDPVTAATNAQNWQVDPESVYMIMGQQIWVSSTPIGTQQVLISIKAPLQYLGLAPNTIDIRPFPAFATNLQGVLYMLAGTTTWVAADLSYLPSYNGEVPGCGPVRVYLPNQGLSQICLVFDISESDVWGLHSVKLWNTQYASTGLLAIQNPYLGTVESIVLQGMNPTQLASLSVNIVANEPLIALSSTNTVTTPVITGVVMQTS